MDESGTGNFLKGSVNGCYIGCTKYLPNIKKRSTGIEVKDPNITYSNFQINGNDIDVDQPEAYSPFVDTSILPIGINVVAMHIRASNNAMVLNIGTNNIDLIKGHRGIVFGRQISLLQLPLSCFSGGGCGKCHKSCESRPNAKLRKLVHC